MATRLSLYNGALLQLGQRPLATLMDDNESRRLCDRFWTDGNFLRVLLEQGLWTFAMRTSRVEATPNYEPAFGFRYAFEKSEDWVRTAAVSHDGRFAMPEVRYADEAGFLYSDYETLWVRFVSTDDDYGGDLSRWPSMFETWAQLALAVRLAPTILDSQQELLVIERRQAIAKIDALAKDAMQSPTQFMPPGSWVVSRWGRHGGGRWGSSRGWR